VGEARGRRLTTTHFILSTRTRTPTTLIRSRTFQRSIPSSLTSMQPNSTNQMPHPAVRSSSRTPPDKRFACAREDGQALVELAFVLPILLLLVFAIVWFALALNSANDGTHLANEVARYATVNENPSCTAEACSTGLAAWGKNHSDSTALKGQTLCIKFPEDPASKTSGQIGDPVEVVVRGAINWLPILKLGPTELKIERTAVMRLEAAPTEYKEECA
jgi:hypothetical protein